MTPEEAAQIESMTRDLQTLVETINAIPDPNSAPANIDAAAREYARLEALVDRGLKELEAMARPRQKTPYEQAVENGKVMDPRGAAEVEEQERLLREKQRDIRDQKAYELSQQLARERRVDG